MWDAQGEPLRLRGFAGFVHAANSAALGQRVRELVLSGETAARPRWASQATMRAIAVLGAGFVVGFYVGKGFGR